MQVLLEVVWSCVSVTRQLASWVPTSATSSIGGGLLDRSLLTALFAALGAISVDVVAVNPGALRGTGACMTGGGVGDRTGVDLYSGELSGLLRIDSTIEPASLGFTTTGIMGGGNSTSGCSAMGSLVWTPPVQSPVRLQPPVPNSGLLNYHVWQPFDPLTPPS